MWLWVPGQATKTLRFAQYPPFLAVHLRRYVMGPDWTPQKLDALVPVPLELDLDALRGCEFRLAHPPPLPLATFTVHFTPVLGGWRSGAASIAP